MEGCLVLIILATIVVAVTGKTFGDALEIVVIAIAVLSLLWIFLQKLKSDPGGVAGFGCMILIIIALFIYFFPNLLILLPH